MGAGSDQASPGSAFCSLGEGTGTTSGESPGSAAWYPRGFTAGNLRPLSPQATAGAYTVFSGAIGSMSIADAKGILNGDDKVPQGRVCIVRGRAARGMRCVSHGRRTGAGRGL